MKSPPRLNRAGLDLRMGELQATLRFWVKRRRPTSITAAPPKSAAVVEGSGMADAVTPEGDVLLKVLTSDNEFEEPLKAMGSKTRDIPSAAFVATTLPLVSYNWTENAS